MKFYGHWFYATLDAVFTGLAQVAGALGNGPQQALGKEVELQRLKRRASPTVEPNMEDGVSPVSKKVGRCLMVFLSYVTMKFDCCFNFGLHEVLSILKFW